MIASHSPPDTPSDSPFREGGQIIPHCNHPFQVLHLSPVTASYRHLPAPPLFWRDSISFLIRKYLDVLLLLRTEILLSNQTASLGLQRRLRESILNSDYATSTKNPITLSFNRLDGMYVYTIDLSVPILIAHVVMHRWTQLCVRYMYRMVGRQICHWPENELRKTTHTAMFCSKRCGQTSIMSMDMWPALHTCIT